MNKFNNKVNEYLTESQQSGPPYIVRHKFNTTYYKDPEHTIKHREDGPAVIFSGGDKKWFQNNKLHRLDGPAVIYSGGDKYWYKNGKLHREDGPAYESPTGANKRWWVNGESMTGNEFNEYLKKKELSKEIQSHKNNRIDPRMLEDYL